MSFGVSSAVIGGAIIGGAATYISGKKANESLERGANLTVEEQRRQYDQTRADYTPWRESGQNALGRLDRASTGDATDFYKSAGYDFVRGEGMRDVENRFSVGGGGGNAMKALTDYTSGLASTEYGNWWNRQSGLAGQGYNATTGTAVAGANAANQIGGAYQNLGRGQANNAWAMGQGINNAMQGGISNWLYGRKTGQIGKKKDKPVIYGG